MDRPGRHGRPAHAEARRHRPLVTPLRHQIKDALAAGTMPENEIREWILPSAIRGGMGLLLRTKRHTATGKQIQVLVAAVNRHMTATPSEVRRRAGGSQWRHLRCPRSRWWATDGTFEPLRIEQYEDPDIWI